MLLASARAVPALTLPTNGIGPRGHPTARIVLNDSWPGAPVGSLLGHNAAPNTLIWSNNGHTTTAHVERYRRALRGGPVDSNSGPVAGQGRADVGWCRVEGTSQRSALVTFAIGCDTGLVHLRLRPSAVPRRRFGADSIRELVFGIEDGVVQNMTLIAGMVGASLSNHIIVIAAAINAIAGVLSMAMGTYLSSKAERDVALAASDEEAAVGHRINGDSPLRDALVMAGAYTVGAVVPLLPFAFGIESRAMSVLTAVSLTALTLFGLRVGKAIVSEQRRIRSGVEMLALASVAGIAGYLIGIATRAVFGLEV